MAEDPNESTAELDDKEPVPAVTDTKPKSAARKRAPRKRASRAGRPRKSVKIQVEALFTVVGTMWASVDPVCGVTFMEQVPELATALDLWAQQDKRLYDFIVGSTAASGPLAFAIATMPIATSVAGHHVIPAVQRRRERVAEAQAFEAEHAWEEDGAVPVGPEDVGPVG